MHRVVKPRAGLMERVCRHVVLQHVMKVCARDLQYQKWTDRNVCSILFGIEEIPKAKDENGKTRSKVNSKQLLVGNENTLL